VSGLRIDQRCTLDVVSLHDTVKIIDCTGGSVHIGGKCKVLLVDSCRGVTLRVAGAICGAEVVNCEELILQTGTSVPMVAIDKSIGVAMQLGGKTEIITASSEGVTLRLGLGGSVG
jgi:hypothetical protein